MEVKYVIADSGGSSTSWALVYDNKEVKEFRTRSMHPKYVLADPEGIRKELHETFGELDAPLYFYGAGCASEAVQNDMRNLLHQAGFSAVEVYPDTLAACRALYGKEAGWVGILGTGSILVHYDGNRITDRIGGYGSLVGDEGSGFYFGKLLVRFLLESPEWETSWVELFGSKENILGKLAGAEAQQWLAGLGQQSAHLSCDFLHRENAALFWENYGSKIPGLDRISFIGTYGFEQQTVFKEVFQKQGVTVLRALASPMEDLLRFHRMNESLNQC